MPRGQSKPPFSADELLGLIGLNPCTIILYHWLQIVVPEANGDAIELEDFCAFTQTGGRKGYSMKWVKVAFRELLSHDLVTIEKSYNSRVFKLKVWKPGQKAIVEAGTIEA
jgi:hypothetical protein